MHRGFRDLFPPLDARRHGWLPVGDGHTLYWEECGNPDGVPVVFLHGGPGAGAAPDHRRFFDPAHYRIVVYDQRGAGRSQPFAETRANTTTHLVADLAHLRQYLAIDRWLLFGGSWGSTLALAYAQTYPETVTGLILRGVFLCRRREIDWFLHGMGRIFPEAWARFVDFLPEGERGDLLAGYHRRLMDPDPAVHLPAARSWSIYEGACSTLLPSPDTVAAFGSDRLALGLARIEAHYFLHDVFLPENALLDNIARLHGLPAAIIQGRYDIVCPPESAHALHHAWPGSTLTVVPDAGHAAMEPGLRRALVGATERFKRAG